MPPVFATASRTLTLVALAAIAAISWGWLARSADVMATMRGDGILLALATAMMQPAPATPYLAATALMWVVMMAAMMTPAVLPLVRLFGRLERGASRTAQLDGVLFATGYLVVWFAFAVVATLLQWALHHAALLGGHALAVGPGLAGALLVGAGVYQLTPLKSACLRHCQTPVGFFLSHWRDGRWGALRMGARHGTYCVGCCWALMLLMFVSGVMSLGAMTLLSAFVLGERLLPAGPWITRLPAAALMAWGVWTLAQLR